MIDGIGNGLSFEQAPPLSIPLRFFLTAPVFLLLAGGTMMATADTLFLSRWTPAALATTHLITTGFMLQVMLGALFQLLPVAAGAQLPWAQAVARGVHVASALGAVSLASGFLTSNAIAIILGGALLASATGLFILASAVALWRTPARGPSVAAIRWALVWLFVTILIGALMGLARGGLLDVSVLRWVQLHVAAGLIGWGGLLVAGTAYLVVPMFQLTPAYPQWFSRSHAWLVSASLMIGAVVDIDWSWAPTLAAVAGFALMTLDRLRRRRRGRTDATLRVWLTAMGCTLSAVVTSIAALMVDSNPLIPLLTGILVLLGGYVALISGMLYKIVPFIVWLYLQPRRARVPAMTRMLDAGGVRWQLRTLFSGLVLSACALVEPALGALAGASIALSAMLLIKVLIHVARHAAAEEATPPQPS